MKAGLRLSRIGRLASAILGPAVTSYPEAEWLLGCCAPDGAILETPGDVNVRPYMSHYGCIGLARAYEVGHKPAYANAAWAWLHWYADRMDPSTGYVNDYTGTSGNWRDSGAADSTDAYAGMYLMALWTTYQATGNFRELASLAASIPLAVHAITSTQQDDGLTWALPSYHAKYLEDNIEALVGLRSAGMLAAATTATAPYHRIGAQQPGGVQHKVLSGLIPGFTVGQQAAGQMKPVIDNYETLIGDHIEAVGVGLPNQMGDCSKVLSALAGETRFIVFAMPMVPHYVRAGDTVGSITDLLNGVYDNLIIDTVTKMVAAGRADDGVSCRVGWEFNAGSGAGPTDGFEWATNYHDPRTGKANGITQVHAAQAYIENLMRAHGYAGYIEWSGGNHDTSALPIAQAMPTHATDWKSKTLWGWDIYAGPGYNVNKNDVAATWAHLDDVYDGYLAWCEANDYLMAHGEYGMTYKASSPYSLNDNTTYYPLFYRKLASSGTRVVYAMHYQQNQPYTPGTVLDESHQIAFCGGQQGSPSTTVGTGPYPIGATGLNQTGSAHTVATMGTLHNVADSGTWVFTNDPNKAGARDSWMASFGGNGTGAAGLTGVPADLAATATAAADAMALGLGAFWDEGTKTWDYASDDYYQLTPNDWSNENSQRQQIWVTGWGGTNSHAADVVAGYVNALPGWSTQTNAFEVMPVWAYRRLGDTASAGTGAAQVTTTVASTNHAYPWTVATSGQLIVGNLGFPTAFASAAPGIVFPAGVNLIANSDFALDSDGDGRADGLANYGGPTMTLIPQSSGTGNIQQMEVPAGQGWDMHWANPIPVIAHRYYTFSIYKKALAFAANGQTVIKIEMVDANGNTVDYGFHTDTAVDADFVRWQLRMFAKTNVVAFRCIIGVDNGGTIQVKNVKLEQAGSATAWTPEPGAAVAYTDTFSRADGALTGPYRTTVASLSGGTVKVSGAGEVHLNSSTTISSIAGDFTLPDGSPVALRLCAADANNCYQANFDRSGASGIYTVIGGTVTQIAVSMNVFPTSTPHLEFSRTGSMLTLRANGTMVTQVNYTSAALDTNSEAEFVLVSPAAAFDNLTAVGMTPYT